MSDKWRPGDHYLIDDVSGFKIRASDSVKQWDEAVVHRDNYEPRQPQDFVQAVPDQQTVATPRPEPIYTFIGPLDTEIAVAALAGSGGITVSSTTRMQVGDRLSIMMDDGGTFLCNILGVTGATTLLINPPLPGPSAVGNKIYDNTAMAEPTLP